MPIGNSRITGPDRNGYIDHEQNTANLKAKLERALYILNQMPEGAGFVSLETTDAMVELHHLLYRVTDYMPKVKCFVVMKHYASHDQDPNDGWKPAVWVGCTTREQAEAIAPALTEHYEKRGYADRFEVEEGLASITNILRPDLTVEEYMRGLQ